MRPHNSHIQSGKTMTYAFKLGSINRQIILRAGPITNNTGGKDVVFPKPFDKVPARPSRSWCANDGYEESIISVLYSNKPIS